MPAHEIVIAFIPPRAVESRPALHLCDEKAQTVATHRWGEHLPQECAYQDPARPHGQIVNVAETFKNGSIRLVRDIPVGTPSWKRLYHRARNASEFRNSVLEGWGLKRLPFYGEPRGRALTALADLWLNLSTLARLVRETTAAARSQPS